MKDFKLNLYTILFVALLGFGASPLVLAEEEVVAYVDIDGDGINDNIDDSDGDGIPNTADPDVAEVVVNLQPSNTMDFGATINKMGLSADVSTNSEKYGQNSFSARALTQNRCGFTSEETFGSGGLGIDVGGGGGACAGGVCH